jgi:glycosyltransferase involved in cell wall biosynthesis
VDIRSPPPVNWNRERIIILARVSVGVPAYRNEATICAAFDSIIAQTVEDLEVIVSDDGSPDGTWDICCAYAARDERFRVFHQKKNLYYLNFLFVLEQASAPYFAWLAADDVWSPTYLEECLAVLDARPDVVACVARCQFVSDSGCETCARGTGALNGEWADNVARFLRDPSDNTRMYGLFRREALKSSFPRQVMHAYDWALSAASLKHGKHYEVAKVLMSRQVTPRENYVLAVKRDQKFVLFRVFPVLKMSLYLIFNRQIPIVGSTLRALCVINFDKHEEYLRIMHPRVRSALSVFYGFMRKCIISRL